MAHDARKASASEPIPRQTLLMQALIGLIRAAARQIDPPVIQGMVREVGEQLGRQALSEYCLARHATGRFVGYTWAECLKEIAAQFGWTLRVSVESEGVIYVTVLGCQVAEPDRADACLCEFASGLFGGAMAEAIGDVKVCERRCSEAPPLQCVFAIYYRASEESLALPGVVYGPMSVRTTRPVQRPLRDDPDVRLTVREGQILRHIAQGLSDKKIAAELQLSVRTVENHAARIRKKLQAGNRAALVRFALQSGLIESR